MAAALLAWPPPPQHPMLLPWHRPRLLPGVHVPQGPCPPAGTHRVGGAHRVWAQSWRGGHAGRVCVELCTLMVCVLRGLHAHGCVGAHRGVQGRVCALTGCGCSRGGGGALQRGVCTHRVWMFMRCAQRVLQACRVCVSFAYSWGCRCSQGDLCPHRICTLATRCRCPVPPQLSGEDPGAILDLGWGSGCQPGFPLLPHRPCLC